MRKMKIGVMNGSVFSLPRFPVTLFSDVAVAAEQLGFDGYFVNDHFNLPWGDETCHPQIQIAYTIAKTRVIDLGNVVLPIPRYSPADLAKQIAHMDILAQGRTLWAYGAGNFEREFNGFSPMANFPEARTRVQMFLEGAELMRKLWTEDEVTFHGKYYTCNSAVLKPKPFQKPYPPMLNGGAGPYMRRMAAKHFDGWVTVNWRWTAENDLTAEGYRARVDEIKDHLKHYGRDPDKFIFMVEGGIEDSVNLVEAYHDAGCTYYVPSISPYAEGRGYPFQYFPEEHIIRLKKFAEDVLPSFK
jgi:alkanesulfonate monooxygenase SsuD/methylene tetrahydromethanopterin reductase-like flavin-dependent oxidoreductase (luciferase family)